MVIFIKSAKRASQKGIVLFT